VTFTDNGTLMGTGTLAASGTSGIATLTTSVLTSGNHTIIASYPGASGSPGFNASTGTLLPDPPGQTVNLSGTNIVLASDTNPATFGDTVTFTATLSSVPSGATPTGAVTFSDGSTTLGTASLDGSGAATFTTSTLTTGTHAIAVSYAGDATHTAATASLTPPQAVNPASTTTTVTSAANPTVFGQPTTFTATVASSAGTPTGVVQFSEGGIIFDTEVLSGGTATSSSMTYSAGKHTVVATYLGDFDHLDSTSSDYDQMVARAQTTVTLATSSNPVKTGTSVTFSANASVVAPGVGQPLGKITFLDGVATLGSVLPDANGTATFTTSLTVGTHSIIAVYEGDSNFDTSTSPAIQEVVTALASVAVVTVTSSLNPSTYSDNVTFTATVLGGSGGPTGTVDFTEGTTTLGSGTLFGGVTTFATSFLGVGPHTITATYRGNGTYAPGSAGSLVQQVDRASSQTVVTSSLNPSTFGQPVTFTATVSSSVPPNTGNVEFFDGPNSIGKTTLATNPTDTTKAMATLTLASLAIGTHSITARYIGDGIHTQSLSKPMSQTVNPEPPKVDDDAGATPPPELDSGTPIVADAGTPKADDSGPDSGTVGAVAGGGCGCRTTDSSPGGILGTLCLLGVAAAGVRRRNRLSSPRCRAPRR
jgi:MYXO-CTERM domain-containing protein